MSLSRLKIGSNSKIKAKLICELALTYLWHWDKPCVFFISLWDICEPRENKHTHNDNQHQQTKFFITEIYLRIKKDEMNPILLKSLNSYISVLHNFNVGKSVSNSRNLLAGSTAVFAGDTFLRPKLCKTLI